MLVMVGVVVMAVVVVMMMVVVWWWWWDDDDGGDGGGDSRGSDGSARQNWVSAYISPTRYQQRNDVPNVCLRRAVDSSPISFKR